MKAGLAEPQKPVPPSTPPAAAAARSVWADLGLIVALAGLTCILTSYIFPPRTFWPLSFVCLTPWALAVCRLERPWVMYWGSWLAGWCFFLVNLYWLWPVTDLGFVALAFYLAVYWPLSAWAIRTGRRAGISVIWTLPVAWVACELLRGWVMSGFPWLFISHSFYSQTSFIQISDITGAYGVTFLAVLVNGVLVEWLLRAWPGADEGRGPRRQLLAGTIACGLLLAGNIAYGRFRLGQNTLSDGPTIAVVQEDFPQISRAPYGDPPWVMMAHYLRLGADAARLDPDLVVFPETAWGSTQNLSFLEVERQALDDISASTWSFGKLCHEATSAFARGDYATVNGIIERFEGYSRDGQAPPLPRLPTPTGPAVAVVLGSVSVESYPEATYPRVRRFNSALIYDDDGTQRRERYDKTHLVPFGEVVPFRNSKLLGLRLHWLYRWLNSLSPFSRGGQVEYSLWPGDEYTVFPLRLNDPTSPRFGVPICYEDVMPYVIRRFVWDGGRRRVDFLLNISNDGWFNHSSELPQHLAICTFRAVENRVSIARAVNTGISGFIDSNGRIQGLVERDGRSFGSRIIGFSVARVQLDTRGSLYGRTGDWFAGICLLLTTILWVGAVSTRWIVSAQRHVAAIWRRRFG